MFSIEGLKQQLAQYQLQQKQAEQLYQQCAGVMALLSQQIQLLQDFEEAKLQHEKQENGEANEQAEEQAA